MLQIGEIATRAGFVRRPCAITNGSDCCRRPNAEMAGGSTRKASWTDWRSSGSHARRASHCGRFASYSPGGPTRRVSGGWRRQGGSARRADRARAGDAGHPEDGARLQLPELGRVRSADQALHLAKAPLRRSLQQAIRAKSLVRTGAYSGGAPTRSRHRTSSSGSGSSASHSCAGSQAARSPRANAPAMRTRASRELSLARPTRTSTPMAGFRV